MPTYLRALMTGANATRTKLARPVADTAAAREVSRNVAPQRTIAGLSGVAGHNLARLTIFPPQAGSDCAAPAPAGLTSLVAATGRPLPEPLRAAAETQFGRPLSNVRLHVGTDADRMARAAGARAFTLGRDIVFRTGYYAPESRIGRELLWHELRHVVEPRARIGLVLRAPLYELGDLAITEPARTMTYAWLRSQLDAKIKQSPGMISADIKGAPLESVEAIFLLNILYQVATPARKGTVLNLQTAIGWVPSGKAGTTAAAPMGLVTVTIDDSGKAVAELVKAGTVAPSAIQADVRAQIESTYGAIVEDVDAKWSPEELADVAGALALLPAVDHAALKGVRLQRVEKCPAPFQDYNGFFSAGGGSVTTRRPATLKLATSAFPKVQLTFLPGKAQPVPSTYATILHEVGHAVEEERERKASAAYISALTAQSAAVKQSRATLDLWNADYKLGGALSADLKVKYESDVKSAAAAAKKSTQTEEALAGTRIPAATVNLLEKNLAVKRKAFTAASKTAGAGKYVAASAPYRDAIAALTVLLNGYEKRAKDSTLHEADADLVLAVTARQAAKDQLTAAPADDALTAFAPVEAAQDAWMDALRTLAHTRSRTRRLDKFVSLVKAANITPFTRYSRLEWPYSPAEFYAEAYSLWLTDPKFVELNYEPVYKFFAGGEYLKP